MTISKAIARVEALSEELYHLGKEYGYDIELRLAQDIPAASTLHTYHDGENGELVFHL